MAGALRQVWVVVWKDLMIDLRRKENVFSMFFFALLTLLVFNFAAGALQDTRYRLSPAVIERLLAEGLPQATGAKLSGMVGRTFAVQADFVALLAQVAGPEMNGAERVQVVMAAKGQFLQDIAAGLLWVTFLLAGVLGLDRSFNQEKDNGCMDGLLMTPVSRGVLYLGKMSSNALFLLLIMAMLLPLFALFFQVDMRQVWLPLVGVILAGIVGITALGTLLGGVVSSLRGKEVLFPLLLFPLLVPILIGVVQLTAVVLEGEPLGANSQWLRLVLGFDAIYLVISYLVFDQVMEA